MPRCLFPQSLTWRCIIVCLRYMCIDMFACTLELALCAPSLPVTMAIRDIARVKLLGTSLVLAFEGTARTHLLPGDSCHRLSPPSISRVRSHLWSPPLICKRKHYPRNRHRRCRSTVASLSLSLPPCPWEVELWPIFMGMISFHLFTNLSDNVFRSGYKIYYITQFPPAEDDLGNPVRFL